MDTLSLSIIKRVLAIKGTEPYIKFILFTWYEPDIVKQTLQDVFDQHIDLITSNTKKNIHIYQCSLRNESSTDNTNIDALNIVLEEYNYLVDNNLLMINPRSPYKLVNICTGEDLVRIIPGNAIHLINNIWTNESYEIYSKLINNETMLELVPI